MAVTINASTSAGLVNTADTSGVLQLQTAGTTALTVDASQNVTLANGTTIQGLTVGRGAGAVATNTAVGASALAANTSGANNTAVGQVALDENTTGSVNVAFGVNTLGLNTTGSENSAIGVSSLSANTTGSYNTALGRSALVSNTTASNNTAVGYQAGYTNATGARNTFIGYLAGYTSAVVSANAYNTFVGAGAGQYTTTGAQNTFIGDTAGQYTTGGFNTFIGQGSGFAITSGTKNSILGMFPGNQGGLDIRTASNHIVLSDGDGNPQAYCNNTSAWILGKGGTSSTNDGVVYLNGPAVTNGGSALVGQINGSTNWYVGSYSAVVGGGSNGSLTCRNSTGGVFLSGTGATSWTAVSDERLKENLVPITDALNKVSTLRTVIGNYTFDKEKARKPFLIAQDVQAVLPEAVSSARQSKEDETEYLGVSYTETIPLLVAAIQELKAEIDALKGTA